MAELMDTNTITTMFPAQDYSLDDHYKLTHLKYDLAPPALARLSQALAELQTRNDGGIACSFRARNHPECEKLKRLAAQWARLHFGDNDIIGCDKLIASDFHLLATMAMAGGRSERMPAAVKLMVWFFVFDNFMDEPAHMGADTAASQHMVDAVMTVFFFEKEKKKKAEIVPEGSGSIGAIREAARDWWEEMRRLGMSARQQRRFVSVFERYLDANTEQVAFRKLRHIPDLDMYKALRLHSIGWYVSSLTLEFALGLDLPDDIVEHPLLSALEVAAAFHITFVNDIFSFRKELSDGDLMNLVPVLLWHNLGGMSSICGGGVEAVVRETVAQALALVRELDGECVRLVAEIRAAVRGGNGPLADEGAAAAVDKYVDGISDWLAGNLRWHRISKRYIVQE